MEELNWNKIMLEIKNVKKYFGGIKAVNGASFKIKKGEITALIGPNGAGKSTIFNLISGIIKPDSGDIIFKEKEIDGSSPDNISNLGISRLFQKANLFENLTVKDNLNLAINSEDDNFFKSFFSFSKNKNEKIIKENLSIIKMEKFENELAEDLSYGQKRLVEIIRTILNPHDFLMLDELVAGVNPLLRKIIVKILNDLKKKEETILLIEHDMNFTFKVSDRIIVLEKGKVIADGNPKEIKNNKRVLSAYLGG